MNWTTIFLTQHVGWIDPEMPDNLSVIISVVLRITRR